MNPSWIPGARQLKRPGGSAALLRDSARGGAVASVAPNHRPAQPGSYFNVSRADEQNRAWRRF